MKALLIAYVVLSTCALSYSPVLIFMACRKVAGRGLWIAQFGLSFGSGLLLGRVVAAILQSEAKA